MKIYHSLLFIAVILLTQSAQAHDFHQHKADEQAANLTTETQALKSGFVQYLGNEALLVVQQDKKLLFDPFFHDNLNTYQLVPEDIKQQIFAGSPPFDQITAVFISHAHRDHFAVDSVVKYLSAFEHVVLYAPQQAVTKVKDFITTQKLQIAEHRLVAISLAFGDKAWQHSEGGLSVTAVRIPHAGWPSRAEIENIVFSVAFNDGSSIMHMGDADPDDVHYLPYKPLWQQRQLTINFPPYWFFFSAEGRDILTDIIGAQRNIGIHVPMKVPAPLETSSHQYFSTVGQTQEFTKK